MLLKFKLRRCASLWGIRVVQLLADGKTWVWGTRVHKQDINGNFRDPYFLPVFNFDKARLLELLS